MMTLKKCFNCVLAFTMSLSLAMANVKADDLVYDDVANDNIVDDVAVNDVATNDVITNENYYREYFGQTSQESIFVSAFNEYRAARGLHPVAVCSELSGDCRRWSTQMRQRGHLSHDPTGGIEICARISRECGISALQAWQRSPAHNAVLLSSRIDTIGIGSDGNWWTMRGRQSGGRHTVFRPMEFRPTDVLIPDVEVAGLRIPGLHTSAWQTSGLRTPASPAPVTRAEVTRAEEVHTPDSDPPGSRTPGLRASDVRRSL